MTKIPKGIRFADRASRANYLKALRGKPDQRGFLPMLVIHSSRHGSGKTTLARHLLESRYGSAEVSSMPRLPQKWSDVFNRAAKNGYLFFDGLHGVFHSDHLTGFLMGEQDWVKWSRLNNPTFIESKFQVVVTGHALALSVELARRSLFVELT